MNNTQATISAGLSMDDIKRHCFFFNLHIRHIQMSSGLNSSEV